MDALETDRLTIRNFQADDWRELQRIIVEYQRTEYAQFDHPWPTDDEGIKNAVAWFMTGDGYLADCLQDSGQHIGPVAIARRDDLPGVVHNLGYILAPWAQGLGYATEACRAAMGYLFGELEAERIQTGTHPSNEPSVRLLARLGLAEVGQGEYAISREEWLAR